MVPLGSKGLNMEYLLKILYLKSFLLILPRIIFLRAVFLKVFSECFKYHMHSWR